MSAADTRSPRTSTLVSLPDGFILMPGESTSIDVSMPDQQVLLEPYKSEHWMQPQLASITNNKLSITNLSNQPITSVGKKKSVEKYKITTVQMQEITDHDTVDHRLNVNSVVDKLTEPETIGLIKFGETEPEVKHKIDSAHLQYKQVFSRDLTGGYNQHFGRHICRLNWTSL